MSPSCEAITLVEKLVMGFSEQAKSHSVLTDKLLDLRSSFSLMRQDPEGALLAFYEIQSVLQKRDYLAYYKLRKLMAKHIYATIMFDGEVVEKSSVDLRWSSLERFEASRKRKFFENAEDLISCDRISISYVCELI